MSGLWTPGGERPAPPPRPRSDEGPTAGTGQGAGAGQGPGAGPDAEAMAELAELQRQLAEAPIEAVVANHCYGLFELAALHLSLDPPNLAAARLAIDALGALVEGLTGRLGEPEPQLQEGLAQLRLAFVQVSAARGGETPGGAGGPGEPGAAAPGGAGGA